MFPCKTSPGYEKDAAAQDVVSWFLRSDTVAAADGTVHEAALGRGVPAKKQAEKRRGSDTKYD